MTEKLELTLNEAYELIEANRIDEAKRLIQPLLQTYPDEPDVWWVYAHAVDNKEDARKALQEILRIDSDFTEAEKLLEEIETQPSEYQPPKPSILPLSPKPDIGNSVDATTDVLDDDFPEDFDNDDDEDYDYYDADADGKPNWLVIAVAGALFAIVIIGVLAMSLRSPVVSPTQQAGVPTATVLNTQIPTAQAQNQSVTAVATVAEATADIPTTTVEPTDEPETATPMPTDTPAPAPEDELLASLDMFSTNSDTPYLREETSLGDTLLIQICLGEQASRADVTLAYFEELALTNIDAEIGDAIGLTLMDCEQDETIRSIAVSSDTVERYRNEELNREAYLSELRPVG